MTLCRYDADLGYRVLVRSETGEPCTAEHCRLCVRTHLDDTTPQVCAGCVGLVRENLATIVELTDRLEDQACHTHADGRLNTGPLGGDAMVMLAEGRYLPASRLTPEEQCNDPMPPLLVLATWEDDWRIELGHRGGPRATVWRCADYLGTHLTLMAQRHPAFDEFAADLARLRGRLEAVLHDGDREDHAEVSCFECSGRLVRRVTDRGADDHWTCGRCRRRYTDPEYHLAVRARLEAIRDQEPA